MFTDEPTHVSDSPPIAMSQKSVHSRDLGGLTPDSFASSLRDLLEDRDRLIVRCRKLELELERSEFECSEAKEENKDMRERLQKHHDSMEHAKKFAAYIAWTSPDFEDSAASCNGCAASEFEIDLAKYHCASRNCPPLLLCMGCLDKHPVCVKCKLPMRNENGWTKRRRLPPSWTVVTPGAP